MKNRKLVILSIVLAGALLASAIMQKFTPNQSWMAFVGWVIFFLAIQLPWILATQKNYDNCTALFNRLRKKHIKQ